MIRQCLSNKNESATVPKTKKFSELGLVYFHPKPKIFKIFRHIESLDVCMQYQI